jgi:hypothetical protein
MHVNRTLLIYGDGTGAYTLTIGFREPTPNQPSSISQNTVTTMETFGARVLETGGSYHRYQDQGYDYWIYTRPFSSVDTANTLLQEDPRPFDQTHFPLLFHDSLHLTLENWLFSSRLHLTGEISLVDFTGKATNWKDATESVTISMPDGIVSYHGGARDGNSITYTIGYNQSAAIDVLGESKLSGGTVPSLVVSVGLLALAILAVTLLLLGIRMLRGAAKR